MNIQDIQARLRELNNQKVLSDDEHEEREQLLENLAILRNEARKSKTKTNQPQEPSNKQFKMKREHSIIGKAMVKGLKSIVEHFKEKPVTMEELQALKLKAIKERYKADIAKSKKIQRDSKGDIFGSNKTTRKSSGRTSSRGDSMDDVSRILRSSVKGNNNIKMFSDYSSKDIRNRLR